MGLSYRLYGFGQRSPRPQTKLWHSPPWPLYCDGKSWDSPWVTAADIHAVPTPLCAESQSETALQSRKCRPNGFVAAKK